MGAPAVKKTSGLTIELNRRLEAALAAVWPFAVKPVLGGRAWSLPRS